MGRLLQMPSTDSRDRVRKMAGAGATAEDIAAQLELPVKRVRKLYRHELEQGDAQGKQEAIEKLRDIAFSGENISALIFWIKARCGWRDTGAPVTVAARNYSPLIINIQDK